MLLAFKNCVSNCFSCFLQSSGDREPSLEEPNEQTHLLAESIQNSQNAAEFFLNNEYKTVHSIDELSIGDRRQPKPSVSNILFHTETKIYDVASTNTNNFQSTGYFEKVKIYHQRFQHYTNHKHNTLSFKMCFLKDIPDPCEIFDSENVTNTDIEFIQTLSRHVSDSIVEKLCFNYSDESTDSTQNQLSR